jgi:hypothetical protein
MTKLKVNRKGKEPIYLTIDDGDAFKVLNCKWFFRAGKFISENGVFLHHVLFPFKNFDRKYRIGFKDGNEFNYQKENVFFYHGKIQNNG